MCGIVGFIKTEQSKEINIKQMLSSIQHRGPDEQNYYEDQKVVLGHTRLSIVDIKDGHQPYEFKDLVIVFNGEIYNHKAIRQELKNNDYVFDTNSDTEVLLKAYHFYGNSFIDKLNGMYAFVIYDKIDKSFIISRDYFGIKPLYIYKHEKEFYFSSEVVALTNMLKQNSIDFTISIKAQKEYLQKGFICENTIIENIYEVERGKLFKYKNLNLEFLQNVNYSIDINKTLIEIIKEELVEELDADVEVGVLLSGGIDSTMLTALSSQIKKNLNTFSVAFEDKSTYDESEYAQIVAKKFNTNHHEFLFNEEILLEYLPKLIESIDIPIYDPAMLPMLYLSENVSKSCKVVLSGDGGDELFAGYTHHKVIKYRNALKVISKLLDLFKILKNKNKILKKLLLTPKTLEERVLYDQNIGLNSQLLRKTDLCSMRYGVEVRVPFLSKKVYNYSVSKDINSFINFRYGKIPLRRIVASLVSKELAYKKKQGFRVPIREWVSKGILGKTIEYDLVHNLRINSLVLSNEQLEEYLDNKLKYYKELFSLYLLNNWLKKVEI